MLLLGRSAAGVGQGDEGRQLIRFRVFPLLAECGHDLSRGRLSGWGHNQCVKVRHSLDGINQYFDGRWHRPVRRHQNFLGDEQGVGGLLAPGVSRWRSSGLEGRAAPAAVLRW
jgi:hypothetical protein